MVWWYASLMYFAAFWHIRRLTWQRYASLQRFAVFDVSLGNGMLLCSDSLHFSVFNVSLGNCLLLCCTLIYSMSHLLVNGKLLCRTLPHFAVSDVSLGNGKLLCTAFLYSMSHLSTVCYFAVFNVSFINGMVAFSFAAFSCIFLYPISVFNVRRQMASQSFPNCWSVSGVRGTTAKILWDPAIYCDNCEVAAPPAKVIITVGGVNNDLAIIPAIGQRAGRAGRP